MQRTSTLQQLLQRTQQFVVVTFGVAYILYALFTSLVNPAVTFQATLMTPKYWAALVVLLTLLSVVTLPHLLKRTYLIGTLAFLLVAVYEIPHLVEQGGLPAQLTMWLTVNILVSYLVLGARLGTGINIIFIAAILIMLVTRGPLPPAQLADWFTSIIVMGTVGVIALNVMNFIENNLLVHAQDNERLRAARQDALTDVYGRGAIEEELESAMEHARKTNTPMSVIVTDIDHFKIVNDRYGHATGDDVLRAIAKRLRRNVGGTGGMVGRWGGEEFIVLLPGVAKPDALVVAERLRREISEQPLAGLDVTASFGVASYRGTGDTTDQLFGRADMAMYEAKRSGRNAVR